MADSACRVRNLPDDIDDSTIAVLDDTHCARMCGSASTFCRFFRTLSEPTPRDVGSVHKAYFNQSLMRLANASRLMP